MTRWARAGSTQKHKKMPEDPTPWEEFIEQRKEKNFVTNKVKKISDEAASTSLKKKIKKRLKEGKVKAKKLKSSESEFALNEVDSHCDSYTQCQKTELSNRKKKKREIEIPSQEGEMNALPKKKLKKNRQNFNIESGEMSGKSDSENFSTCETYISSSSFKNKYSKVEKKKLEQFLQEGTSSLEAQFVNDSENKGVESSEKEVESVKSSPPVIKHHQNKKKKKTFFEKVEENRGKNGITLLPRAVENRLYRLKKALRAKGISGEEVKGMVRNARRKAEVNYRKNIQKNSKICFNCRETGHIFADCPKVAEDNEQGTGICFKCGSTEHVSFKCHIKSSDFPFAKCFICHNIGHLSRNCPENERGIYPKGGKCNLCGSVYHLRKDCPKSSRKKKDEEITAHTISELESIDDEIVEAETKTVKQKSPKIVKF